MKIGLTENADRASTAWATKEFPYEKMPLKEEIPLWPPEPIGSNAAPDIGSAWRGKHKVDIELKTHEIMLCLCQYLSVSMLSSDSNRKQAVIRIEAGNKRFRSESARKVIKPLIRSLTKAFIQPRKFALLLTDKFPSVAIKAAALGLVRIGSEA